MKRHICVLIASVIILAGGPAFAQARTILVVTESWQDATNEDGTGLYFDLIRAVFEPLGWTVKYQIMPYTSSVKKVQDKEADIVIGPYEGEVEGVIYPTMHFSADDITAVILKGAPWNGESGFEGKRVTWIRGYSYDEYIAAAMNITVVDQRESAINLLTKKRVDVILDNASDMTETIRDLGLDPAQFDMKLVKYLDLYLCFPQTEKGKQLAAAWDREFGRLVASGKIRSLFQQWDQLMYYDF